MSRTGRQLCRPWGYAWIGLTAFLLLCFFRFYLRQSLLLTLYWSMGLFLTGLFPFQLFMPALFRNVRPLSIVSIGIWGQALGLMLLLTCFRRLDLREPIVLQAFYGFPTLSSLLASLLLFQADHFRYFLVCSEAFVGGFLVLNLAGSSLFPFFGFGSVALATLFVLYVTSALGAEENEVEGEEALVGLFHRHPPLAFVWIVGLLSLSGLFPLGHSWQWRVLATFYRGHSRWVCLPLLGSIILSAVAYFRWIHAAMRTPHGGQIFPVSQGPKAQTTWAVLLATVLCLSWFLLHPRC